MAGSSSCPHILNLLVGLGHPTRGLLQSLLAANRWRLDCHHCGAGAFPEGRGQMLVHFCATAAPLGARQLRLDCPRVPQGLSHGFPTLRPSRLAYKKTVRNPFLHASSSLHCAGESSKPLLALRAPCWALWRGCSWEGPVSKACTILSSTSSCKSRLPSFGLTYLFSWLFSAHCVSVGFTLLCFSGMP